MMMPATAMEDMTPNRANDTVSNSVFVTWVSRGILSPPTGTTKTNRNHWFLLIHRCVLAL